ncbi:Zn(II)2Cys6 transcription factor [Aspergillus ibericus CBS 121593]|uniref:C6 zinc finger domain protein n=1 Tax=Aspergillus ibericus CBS 121593 TaxID=1448316 RepID=A0A395HAE7_9EURO|nr:C6 zinc finger domain protein [Aspergillus ibericus CBS 121593]RAL04660.1 C6 zinc finger domain protein [Aspergillus ibericus CBS 121593]
MIASRRKAKKSKTGCRTCRARRIKCDELPGACRNCTSTGRNCEGYDVYRLPVKRTPRQAAPDSLVLTQTPTGLRWKITSDERRCLSFFQQRTVPDLAGLYESPLWQKLVLQMSHTEPAVYHSVVALGATHQALEITKKPYFEIGSQNIWYQFAQERSSKAVALLTQRRMSQDPQLQEVTLVSCLLFLARELLCGNYDVASQHVLGGLKILKQLGVQRSISGTLISPVEQCVVEMFLHLQMQSVYYGTGAPLEIDGDLVYNQPYEDYLLIFRRLQDAQQAFRPLLNTAFLFVASCRHRSDEELLAIYGSLEQEQLLLLSYFNRYLERFELLYHETYTNLSQREQREADMTKLTCLSAFLSLKTCLLSKNQLFPEYLTPECDGLLSFAEAVVSRLQSYPTITLDSAVIAALYNASYKCSDFGVRVRAIDAARSWQHWEGFLNSSITADILEESMRAELMKLKESCDRTSSQLPPGVSFVTTPDGQVYARVPYKLGEAEKERWIGLETPASLYTVFSTVKTASKWACVRSLGTCSPAGRWAFVSDRESQTADGQGRWVLFPS